MDIYTAGIIIVSVVAAAWVASAYFDYRKKALSYESQTVSNKKKGSFESQLDNLDMAKKQAVAIYNEQAAICSQKFKEGKMTEKDGQEILKPFKEKIEWLEKIEKYEPLARVGAKTGDKIVSAINKAVDGIG
jgi:hypothetical protein